jgi:ankyrin repeat protein
MVACRHSDLEVVKYLIEELKADFQFVCNSGTPFISAIENNRRDTIEYFINDLSYDINKTDSLGNSPLFIATFNGNLELVEYFM